MEVCAYCGNFLPAGRNSSDQVFEVRRNSVQAIQILLYQKVDESNLENEKLNNENIDSES
mgnify:FL=1